MSRSFRVVPFSRPSVFPRLGEVSPVTGPSQTFTTTQDDSTGEPFIPRVAESAVDSWGPQGARAAFVGGNLFLSVLAAGTAWVGINAGVKEKGFLSVVGWTTGIAAGLATLMHFGGAMAGVIVPGAIIPKKPLA